MRNYYRGEIPEFPYYTLMCSILTLFVRYQMAQLNSMENFIRKGMIKFCPNWDCWKLKLEVHHTNQSNHNDLPGSFGRVSHIDVSYTMHCGILSKLRPACSELLLRETTCCRVWWHSGVLRTSHPVTETVNWCQWRSHYKRSVTNGTGNDLFKTFYWLPLRSVFHRKSK